MIPEYLLLLNLQCQISVSVPKDVHTLVEHQTLAFKELKRHH